MMRRWALRYFPVLLVFSLLRLVLWLTYRQRFFGDLDLATTLEAFVCGVRFDMTATLMFLGPALFILALMPPRWSLPFDLLFAAIAALLVSLQIGDIIYYGYVGRHLADEVLHLGNDLRYLASEAFIAHGVVCSLGVAVIALLVTGYFRLVRPLAMKRHGRGRWLSAALCLLFVVAGVRGSFGLKPVGVVNAFVFDQASAGHLALNGVFTAWHASHNSADDGPAAVFDPERLNRALAPLALDPTAPYPFMRKFTGSGDHVLPSGARPNIVLIMFESLGAFYVDSFHRGDSEKFGATPNFDLMAREGVSFTHFYANGSRSIEAMQNILTSFPAMRSTPTLGLGYEQASTSSLARAMRENGYHTLFAQSAARGSFRLDAIAGALGFQEYYGTEDYPAQSIHQGESRPQFGWDDEMLLFIAEKMRQMPEPFLIVLFTGSAHTPFVEHPPGIALRPGHGPDNEAGFLDLQQFTDRSLGEFVAKVKSDDPSRFARTIFTFTADHMFPPYRSFDYDQQFRVPLLLYAPGMLPAAEITRIGSHLDIMPTLLALSGYRGEVATAGRPLPLGAAEASAESSDDFAFLAGSYGTPALVTRNGILRHSLQKRLDPLIFDKAACNAVCLDTMEERLLAYHQLLYQCFHSNRIMPNPAERRAAP